MEAPLIYGAVNEFAIERIPRDARRLLDIGCGSGTMGARVKQRQDCEIVGVTFSAEEATIAERALDRVLIQDLNHFDASGLQDFDCVVCSHVLEHLYEPQQLLKQLHEVMSDGATLIVALPNVLNWRQRALFLRGRFRYTQGGLMDSTHFRFFDWQTAAQLVEKAGFIITRRVPVGHVPLPGVRRLAPALANRADQGLTRRFPGLFADQFIIVARHESHANNESR